VSKAVSQKTIIETARVLNEYATRRYSAGGNPVELLYEYDFPDWLVNHARYSYEWKWTDILIDMRNGRFFFHQNIFPSRNSITGNYLSQDDAIRVGEFMIQKLAALAVVLSDSEPLLRSLQWDGFEVNEERLALVPLEGPVSAQEEEGRLTVLVKSSGIPNSPVVLKHIADAHSLYADGKDHSSLNESRSLIQELIDSISTETDAHGNHAKKLPGGTANRIQYLKNVNFFTPDEQSAFLSAWGSLCAGSHPGVPERDQARIGLILALEFGQLLLLKFSNWRANGYQGFK
jgi:hypothetical protein